MTDRKKPPSQEILPPERSTAMTRTATPMPGGALDSWTSGFVERIRAVAIRNAADRHKATLEYVNIDTQLHEALKRNLIARADLQDIDNIVNEHLRVSALNRTMARLRDQAALEAQVHAIEMQARQAELAAKDIQQKIWDAEREYERRQQAATSLEVQGQLTNKKAETDKRRQGLLAERDIMIAQTINESIIHTQALIAQTTEEKTRYEYLKTFAVLRKISEPIPATSGTADSKIDELIEQYENQKEIALQAKDLLAVGNLEIVLSTARKIRDKKVD